MPGRLRVGLARFAAVAGMLVAGTPSEAAAQDPIAIRFGAPTDAGMTISISLIGDADGETLISNQGCCGLDDARAFVKDVRIRSGRVGLPASRTRNGWVVRHEPSAALTVSYRLPGTAPMTIDSGTVDQVEPIVGDGVFHLMGSVALLLPRGRADEGPVALSLAAEGIGPSGAFVSSFGAGEIARPLTVPRDQLTRALYLGGSITLDLVETPAGRVGIAFSGMDPGFRASALTEDVMTILETERAFFREGQPWYLVSVHGGERISPAVNVGGGMGLTNSFAMFVRSDFDFSDPEHREHFRWVLAHEYFHHWNGLTLRIAPLAGTDRDDASTYWFTEGFTEFFTMRLLTRAGLQAPRRSLDVMNHKLARYAANGHRDAGAREVGGLFWSAQDAQQVPYLRGYLAAWFLERELRRDAGHQQALDALVRDLVDRARSEPGLRVDTDFLVDYFGETLSASAFETWRRFVVDGGDAPFDADSFAPCLQGRREVVFGTEVLQFDFAEPAAETCFSH